MGMSTHVVGFKPPDDDWKRMYAVWVACEAAGVGPPQEVGEFFKWSKPDPSGVEVDLVREAPTCVREYSSNSSHGFEVLLQNVPPDIKIIRFWNGW